MLWEPMMIGVVYVLLHGLQMSSEKKHTVLFAFATRLPYVYLMFLPKQRRSC